MLRIVLFILLLLSVSGHAFQANAGNGRIVPESREQVSLSFAPLVKKVAPAVVNIYTKRVVTQRFSPFANDPFFEYFFGQSFGLGGGLNRQRVESALGSGVIVDAEGLVITNAHVIEGADEITVVLPDGREFDAVRGLVDKPSDLAVLRIDPGTHTLPYVTLKPSENLEVGDLVLAIGNPFGVGQTVTSGIVSALARSSLDISDFNFFIQTDAAVNPGNSGGPLVAMDGSVVGINTAIFSRSGGSLGIGFAIPSEMVATVLAAAESGQNGARGVIRPWLGLEAQKVTPDIAESLDLKAGGGVLISRLHDASPARKAGLKVGDVVVSVNGRAVRDPAEMKFRTATVPLGSHADFEILRNGKAMTIRVEAAAPPEDPPRNETLLTGGHPLSGAMVARINPAVAVELDLEQESGVVVTGIEDRGQAWRLVRPGDIVLSVNGKEIPDIAALQKALQNNQYSGWNFVFDRNGQPRQIIVR